MEYIPSSQLPVIVFDIETGPAQDAAQFAPDFDAPANYKDPVKIAAHKSEKLVEWINAAALSAISGRVLAIGVRENGKPTVFCSDDESEMLASFWSYVSQGGAIRARMIGFYSNRFDVPFLIRRSWRLGVPVPRGIMHGRYMNDVFVDLIQVWQLGDYQASINLDTLARWLGVGAKNGDGADFATLLTSDRAAALAYLENDLEITERCAIALNVMEAPEAVTTAVGDY